MSTYVGFEQLDVAGFVMNVSHLTIPGRTIRAHLQADGGDIRYTMDGTAPTGAAGMILQDGLEPEWFEVEDLQKIQFVGDGGAACRLNVHYYGTFR